VMRIAHWSRPLSLASLTSEIDLTGATLARSQADPVLLVITKQVHEPRYRSKPGDPSIQLSCSEARKEATHRIIYESIERTRIMAKHSFPFLV
jgi:hypothetical protein